MPLALSGEPSVLREASLRTRRTPEICNYGLGKPCSSVGVGYSEANIRFTFNVFLMSI